MDHNIGEKVASALFVISNYFFWYSILKQILVLAVEIMKYLPPNKTYFLTP